LKPDWWGSPLVQEEKYQEKLMKRKEETIIIIIIIRDVLENRPDIIIKNKKDKICLMIDVATPFDRNVIQMESEKKLKYKNLSIEILQMWNTKCSVIPVITGATGIVTKGLN
jgi:hypothetical protein